MPFERGKPKTGGRQPGLRHSGTVLVRRCAHLSVSHLQDEIEKVSAFGKVPDPQTARKESPAEQSEAEEPAGEEESVEGQPPSFQSQP